jgi:hypothetical protein
VGPTLSSAPCMQIEFCSKSRTMPVPLHPASLPPLHAALPPAAPDAVPSGCSSTCHSCRGPAPPAHSLALSNILRDAPAMTCTRSTLGSGAAGQGASQSSASSASGRSLPQRLTRRPEPSSGPAILAARWGCIRVSLRVVHDSADAVGFLYLSLLIFL